MRRSIREGWYSLAALRPRTLSLITLAVCAACTPRPPRLQPDSPLPLTNGWRVQFGDTTLPAEENAVAGALATDGKVVLLVTRTGAVQALDPATGERLWEVALGPGLLSTGGGAAFLRRFDGGIDALDASTGAILWQNRGGPPGDIPAIASGESLAVLGKAATLLNARTGEKLWATRGLGPFTTAPVFAAGRLVAGTREGAIHCLDLATGKLLWTRRTHAPLSATPVTDDKGHVFIGTADGSVLALSLRSGKRVWEWKTGVETAFAAVCYKDVVCFVPHSAVVLALERRSGHIAWRTVLPSRPLAPPIIRGEVLLILCYGGRENRMTLAAIDLTTGKRIGFFDVQGETKTAPLLLDDRLIFALRDRSVTAMALAKHEGVQAGGLARRRRARDAAAEASPTPTPRRR
jgi:outer membrane protein assembly factor BamB